MTHLMYSGSRGSVVKLADLQQATLGSTPPGNNISHWWQQQGYLTKIAPVASKSPHPNPSTRQSNDVEHLKHHQATAALP